DGNGSFEHKIRFYEAYKDQCKSLRKDHRFRVILVATGTDKRLGHLLARSKELLQLKHRPLVYGVTLGAYLDCATPLTNTYFLDNCRERRALVPPAPRQLSPTAQAAAVALAKVGPL